MPAPQPALGLLVLSFSLFPPARSSAQEPTPPPKLNGIMDNSFFVEEAYNQEPGVVQHIFNSIYTWNSAPGDDQNRIDFLFTQEWPLFSQRHQFSYTLPYSFVHNGGDSFDGLGDMLLNYRYQAFFDEKTLTAFAPRASLVLPTGDADRGLGNDSFGCQANLPFSTTLGDSWFVHANAGLTFLPDSGPAGRHDLLHYNLGASAIYAATAQLHFMLEWIGLWADTPLATGSSYEFESLISPGLRRAFNFANGSQLVVGVAVPIGLTHSAPDIGAFLYVSFEHGFFGSNNGDL
jgi:hypothetical protein